ncbi:MAG TPA: alkaline phosphatase family protein [Rhodanobacteraceae bacterium]
MSSASAHPHTSRNASAAGDLLSSIDHVVVLMLENRSFDHMLGFLYVDAGNVSPAGQPYAGLSGTESNPDATGTPVGVYRIVAGTSDTYFMPGADPGEGYAATNSQLFGSTTAPVPPVATNQGFVTDFAYTLGWESTDSGYSIVPGTVASDIMGMHTPATLPVLSALARGFAVCDHWYGSAPTETLPNRAFVSAATSQGHMDDKTRTFTAPTIYGALSRRNVGWKIYGYDADPLTRHTFTEITNFPDSFFGLFTDFQADAAAGTLPAYAFLEPGWGSKGNSEHPNYDVALGEQFIHDVYYAVRNGPAWNRTLLIITYDEHGGCYDHVPPPTNAVPPDNSAGEYGFDFTRFGPRVPTLLVSPLIPAGSVVRAAGATPFDHTSILKLVERRWNVPALTARDAAAPEPSAALSLATPRTDDPLAGVAVPQAKGRRQAGNRPSHLQQVYADLAARLPVRDRARRAPKLETTQDYDRYIKERLAAWKAARQPS